MELRGTLLLLLATIFWGTAFVAQAIGMDELGPYTYATFRFILGVISLGLVWYAYSGKRAIAVRAGTYQSGWRAGFWAGLAMFVGVTTQQLALMYTTAGKTAFITTFYIVLVPIVAYFLGKKITWQNIVGAVLAVGGLYFLSAYGEKDVNYGDLLVFIGAFFWTGQILVIDRFAQFVDAIELCLMEMIVCAVGSLVLMLMYETVVWSAVANSYIPIIYGGILSCGVAYTLQIVGQGYVEPGKAAILMSFEAVFGVLSGWLILNEQMSMVQIVGCVLMLAGVLVTQIRNNNSI